MIAVKAQPFCGDVAELNETDKVVRDDGTDLLARKPGLLSLFGIGLGLEDLLDLVVGDFPAINRAAMDTEIPLNLCAQIDDLFEQVRLYLVCKIGVVEHCQLAREHRVFDSARLPGVFEEIEIVTIAIDTADIESQFAGPVVVFGFARDGSLPGEKVRLFHHRPDPINVVRDEAVQLPFCFVCTTCNEHNRHSHYRGKESAHHFTPLYVFECSVHFPVQLSKSAENPFP